MPDSKEPLDAYRVTTRQAEVLGTHIDAMRMPDVVHHVEEAIRSNQRLRLGVVNAAKLVNMRTDALLCRDVQTSDLVLADGMSVVWASRILGEPLPERVAGIDLMHEIMGCCNRHGHGVFLLGASEAVSEKVETEFKRLYPGAIIAGRRNGYFEADEEQAIADQIKASGARVLFLAMTSPKKENFMGAWGDHMRIPVIHGVGGSFDVVAGKVKRAPRIFQALGLEWLYRTLQEPTRLGPRYLKTNYLFIKQVLQQRIGRLPETERL
jgi:N-acetylglucosaminyldiphosphoundecaprenol N-acetyl-beta-D-mannosaminyltransferase